MNHVPSYPTIPKTAMQWIDCSKTNITNLITADTSTLLYTVPVQSQGVLFSNLIIAANAANAAGVVRMFLNNGYDYNIQSNNVCFAEYQIGATTANTTTVTAFRQQYVLDILLPPKFRIFLNFGAASITTNSGLSITGSFLEY